MHLTQHTDYGFRILLYLGAEPDRIASVAEIAEVFGISRHHLVKVAHRLGKLGYVDATRGRAGGLRLGLPAAALRLGDIVRGLEPDLAIVECFDRAHNECRIVRECRLTGPLWEAQHAFLAALDKYTLADALTSPALASRLVELRKQAV